MRILLVSFFYPPQRGVGTIGAARVGATAACLRTFGHEVRVLSSRVVASEGEGPPGVEVVRAPSPEVNAAPKAALRALARLRGGDIAAAGGEGVQPPSTGIMGRLSAGYADLLNVPDETVGWIPGAITAGLRELRRSSPDVIFASGAPFSAHVVAAALARHARIPWVAELRDLWTDNHYYRYSALRRRLDRRLEAATLRGASGLVTVSEPLAETLRARHAAPVRVVLNGFDPAAYPEVPSGAGSEGPLRVVYAGRLYGERRDPRPLLQALSLLGDARVDVCLDLYLPDGAAHVRALAAQAGVSAQVRILPPVSHAEALRQECGADLLLLILWNHPDERGVYTGKFFEYLGARRPVLALAPEHNVAARMVRARGLGLASLRPTEIAEYLRARIAEKRAGGVAPLPEAALVGLSRREQTLTLEGFLRECVERGA